MVMVNKLLNVFVSTSSLQSKILTDQKCENWRIFRNSEHKKRPVYGSLIILKFYVSASRMQNIAPNPNDVHIFGGA